MAQMRTVRPGYTVIHPNRDKATSKVTKLLVVAAVLVAAALMAIVTVGGWSQLEGMKPVNFALIVVYVLIALFVLRWSRGMLPLAAGLSILVLMVAVVAVTGAGGTTWAQRAHPGFARSESLFGGQGLTADQLSALTYLMIPAEVLVIVLAMVGFRQGWNVELEVPEDEAGRQRRRTGPPRQQPEPQSA